MKKFLLFDFDGTIADSYESFLEIVDRLIVIYHLPKISRAELETFRAEEPRALIKRMNIPFYKIPFLARDMKKMQKEHIHTMQLFKGLAEVLNTLKNKGFVLCIVTSNGRDNVEQIIKRNKIDIFQYIYSDSSMFGKDAVLRKFMKQHGVAKEDILYIGDEIRDIQACQKVGIKVAAVTWGFNSKEGLVKYHPDFLIDKPVELLKII
jgi:phosphoglycolate phosphatase